MYRKKAFFLFVLMFIGTILVACQKSYLVEFYVEDELIHSQTVKNLNEINMPSEPSLNNYEFDNWYIGEEIYSNNYLLESNIVVKARFYINTYDVSIDGKTIKVNHGDKIVYTTPEDKVGSKYLGLFEGDTLFDLETEIKRDYILETKYERLSYQVKVDGISQTVLHGDKVILPETEKVGHNFLGWFISDEKFDIETLVVNDLEIISKYNKKTYQVKVDGVTTEYEYLEPLNLVIPNLEYGTYFIGWFLDDLEISENYLVERDLVITSKIGRITVEVTIDGQPISVKYGEIINHTPEERLGYRFKGYYVNDQEFDITRKVESNLRIETKYEKVDLIVTIDGIKQTVPYLGKVLFPLNPSKEGHTFKGWFLDELEIDNKYQVKEDITIVSKFKINSYDVYIDDIRQEVTYLNKIKFPEVLEIEGKIFKGWYLDDIEIDIDYLVKSHLNIKSKYEDIILTVLIDNVEYKVVYGNKLLMPEITEIEGMTFDGWYIEDIEFDITTLIKEPLIIKSKFSVTKYKVTIDGVIQYVLHNNLVVLPEIEVEDGKFLGWYIGELEFDPNTKVTSDLVINSKQNDVYYDVIVDGVKQRVIHGGLIEFKVMNDTDSHNFIGWFIGNEEFKETDQVFKDLVIESKFAIKKYQVLIDDLELIVEHGNKVIYEHTIKDGHDFIGLYDKDVLFDMDTLIKENYQLKTKYQIHTFNVTVDGVVTKYDYHSKVKLTNLKDKEEEFFVGWFIGENLFDSETLITEDLIINSKFSKGITYEEDDITYILLDNWAIVVDLIVPSNKIINIPDEINGLPITKIRILDSAKLIKTYIIFGEDVAEVNIKNDTYANMYYIVLLTRGNNLPIYTGTYFNNNDLITEFEEFYEYTKGDYDTFIYAKSASSAALVSAPTGDSNQTLDILDEVEGLPVTKINIFYGYYYYGAVYLPEKLTNIPAYTFRYFIYLSAISIPLSVKTMGSGIFPENIDIYIESPTKLSTWNDYLTMKIKASYVRTHKIDDLVYVEMKEEVIAIGVHSRDSLILENEINEKPLTGFITSKGEQNISFDFLYVPKTVNIEKTKMYVDFYIFTRLITGNLEIEEYILKDNEKYFEFDKITNVEFVIDDGNYLYAIDINNNANLIYKSMTLLDDYDEGELWIMPEEVQGHKITGLYYTKHSSNYIYLNNYITYIGKDSFTFNRVYSIFIPITVLEIADNTFANNTTVKFEHDEGYFTNDIGGSHQYNQDSIIRTFDIDYEILNFELFAINFTRAYSQIDMLDYNNGLPVRGLKLNDEFSNVKTLIIPGTFNSFDQSQFLKLPNLELVIIKEGAENIGKHMFNEDIKVWVEASEKPDSWHDDWIINPDNVQWGYR